MTSSIDFGSLEFGLDTFGDVTRGPDGALCPHAAVLREVVEQGVLADSVGVDFFGVGEHHRVDFAVSAPDVVLAAIAARTTRIRLGSAVTVLSSDDPIRVFQRFATLDGLSGGRAEVILGRGSFTESFPLFGFDLRQYETLFEEKLDLFAALRAGGPVTWQGSIRPPLTQQSVFPPPESQPLRTWIGVGGSPESVVRAARYDMPMLLAIIGGDPSRFRPYVDLSARAAAEFNRPVQPIGVHSPGFVGETDEAARETFWPDYKRMHDQIGSERGWPPLEKTSFEREIERGSLYVGSPETVAAKIARTVKTLGLSRFQLKYSAGPLPHEALLRCIELYGTRVMPLVREHLQS
ncbi:LLM class flavin-dependent oxidoreductase [Aureimonas sp. AU40]|uniref:LLM class flavin-dependent oxidoreductase n=1 Tax=Aureimonas sp. AU40 TaxID=1637747 RepID=UPI000784F8F4|nr:LLM class flavin-dependent oxidoreductase [Aureimonas sp. AU40]